MATVLIADDDPSMLNLLSDMVMENGHVPITAVNGQDALALARTLRPPLIISDVMMPLVDGKSLLAALRTDPAHTNTMIILVSATFPPEQTTIEDTTALLPKPLDIALLEDLLLRAHV